MKRKPKKVRRIILGVGHPWYSASLRSGRTDTVQLTKRPVSDNILFRAGAETVQIDWKDTGNWNKVRLVLEILE